MEKEKRKKKRLTAEEKYPDFSISLHLDPDYEKISKEDIENLKKRLNISGGKLDYTRNILILSFKQSNVVAKAGRGAGKKTKPILKKEGKSEMDRLIYFADIVYWHYGLKESWDKIIDNRLTIGKAAFFKKKKRYYALATFQEFFEQVDLSRADDYEYLKTIYRWDDLFI